MRLVAFSFSRDGQQSSRRLLAHNQPQLPVTFGAQVSANRLPVRCDASSATKRLFASGVQGRAPAHIQQPAAQRSVDAWRLCSHPPGVRTQPGCTVRVGRLAICPSAPNARPILLSSGTDCIEESGRWRNATLGLFICWWGMQALAPAHCTHRVHQSAPWGLTPSSSLRTLRNSEISKSCAFVIRLVKICALLPKIRPWQATRWARVSSHCLVALSQPIWEKSG